MKYKVLMLAFMDGEVREVEIHKPDPNYAAPETILEEIYHFGQNDFQNVPGRCSVSVGDVIILPIEQVDTYWMVRPLGFGQITEQELEEYKKVPRRDRAFLPITLGTRSGD